MVFLKIAVAVLAAAVVVANAKPSLPLGLHAIPDHFDFAPPVLPAPHFHASALAPAPAPLLPLPAPLVPAPVPWLPTRTTLPLLPAPAPLIPAPVPAPLIPAPVPAPLIPAPVPAPLIPASLPAPLIPAAFPAPIIPAPVAPIVHPVTPLLSTPLLHAPILPATIPVAKIVPPLLEAVPFAAPTYRAIPGPKTTTHHISVGYAFPAPTVAKIVSPHAHLHAAPLTLAHHHHHTLF